MTKKTTFTREEVAAAYDAAHTEIIGAHLIHGVELRMDLLHLSEINAADLSDSELECIEWGLKHSNSVKLSVDEFTGRGLENIQDPTELAHSLQTVIMATPETVSKEKVLEICQLPLPNGRGLELSPKGVFVWVADIRATNPYHSARSGTPLLTMQTGVVGCPQSSYPDSWHGKRVMIALSDSSCCLSWSALPFQASDTSNKTMDQQDINISVRTRAIPPHPFGWGLLAQSVELEWRYVRGGG